MNALTTNAARVVVQRTTTLLRNGLTRLSTRYGSSSKGPEAPAKTTDPLNPKDTKAYVGQPSHVSSGYKSDLDRLLRNPNCHKYQNPEKYKLKNFPEFTPQTR